MALSESEVKAFLDSNEPDYDSAASLGAEALPHLANLIAEDDQLLASKAVYLASLIDSALIGSLLSEGTNDHRPVVRVATAAGLRHVSEAISKDLYERLLSDSDLGVRKVALNSIEAAKASYMRAEVERLVREDPVTFIRERARQVLGTWPG